MVAAATPGTVVLDGTLAVSTPWKPAPGFPAGVFVTTLGPDAVVTQLFAGDEMQVNARLVPRAHAKSAALVFENCLGARRVSATAIHDTHALTPP